ncbi:hypothetical protein BDY24DRAFT_370900 [Mrakia frigida]|uniref:uncharacterized protein n=1 Tax=Mrakia frigida TaxID=29902 RepID=UPI003FCBFFA6
MATTTTANPPPTSSRIGFLSGWGNSSLSRTLGRGGASQGQRIVVPLPPSSASVGSNQVSQDGKRQTLFGPHIGGDEEDDEFGGEGGEGEGRKESNPHPTTTLQSLVNLKRPTLSLSPLPSSPINASSSSSSSLHLLKFTYDASSPTVFISIRLILPSPTPTDPHLTVSEVVWAGQAPGGFAQAFVLPEDGAIDLGTATEHLVRMYEEEDAEEKKRMSSITTSTAGMQIGGGEGVTPENSSNLRSSSGRGGLMSGLFRGGRRDNDLEAQHGVAMAPVGASAAAAASAGEGEKKKEVRKGVRVVIRLEARGEKGEALSNLNAQQTHLEITHSRGRSGTTATIEAPPHVAGGTKETPAAAGEGAVAEGVVVVEGRRSTWSVKVIRREALIGSHTFHLREIFGLTSSTTTTTPNPPSTYPPQADDDPYASTPNECIICLVSPRDVVLLPCRHLVVCKECAIGMVEFGAGGKVMRREGEGEFGASETGNGAGEGGAGGGEGGTGTAAEVPVAAAPAPAAGRRKKKAKGWQCPVCRLPYTSMLRVALPSSKPGLETTMAATHPSTHSLQDHSVLDSKKDDDLSHTENVIPVRASSPVPTLPGRAESILAPDGDEPEVEEGEGERPQFVVGAGAGAEEDEEERRRRVEGSA